MKIETPSDKALKFATESLVAASTDPTVSAETMDEITLAYMAVRDIWYRERTNEL